MPQDQGFEDDYDPPIQPKDYHLTLGDIFPNRDADPNNPSGYNFKDINSFIEGVIKAEVHYCGKPNTILEKKIMPGRLMEIKVENIKVYPIWNTE